MTTLIGLMGPKTCGKDELFLYLEQMASPVSRVSIGDEIRKEVSPMIGVPIADIDTEKEYYRPVLQWWGEYRRHKCDREYWIHRLKAQIAKIKEGLVVVTDFRGFPDEVEFFKQVGGYIIRIDRDGAGAGDNHPAENLYKTITDDYVVDNNGSKADLVDRTRELLTWLEQQERKIF